ncbi:MAG: MauE/DoxX family redox-associated membrane protein [Actinomycetota bacterium]
MSVAALVARLVLVAIFAVAGAAKLADRRGTRTAVVAFGVPERLAAPFALLLPPAELAVAVLLLPASTSVVGAAGALGLLVAFAAAIGVNLARGRTPECHCFGQLHSTPAGWTTLARNAALAAVAGFVLVAGGGRSAVAWIGRLSAAEMTALGAAVVILAVLGIGATALLSLLRSYGTVLVRLDRVEALLRANGIDVDELERPPELGLEVGAPAPRFDGLDELLAPGLPLLLVFTNPHCGPCKLLLPRAAVWQREHADALTVAFAVAAPADVVEAEAEAFELAHAIVDTGLEIYEAYEANGTPSAVLVAPDGTIASRLAAGPDWIEQLVGDALTPEPGVPVGRPLPDIALVSLAGDRVALSDLRGRESLLLFWNPDCGYCRALHPDVLEWERRASGDGQRLVVVSSGDAERTRADGFSSLVLLDDAFAAGEALGASGTPMAVAVDADGRVASKVAAGAAAILALVQDAV